jgi:hypothetical protein
MCFSRSKIGIVLQYPRNCGGHILSVNKVNAADAAEVMQLRCCCNGSISAAQLVSTSAKDKSIAAEERRSRGKAALCDF